MLKPVKRTGSPFWVARGTVNGIRVERSTGAHSLIEARRLIPSILAQIVAEQARHQSQGAPHKHHTEWRDMPFPEAVIAYLDNGGEGKYLNKLLDFFGSAFLGQIDNAMMARASAALYPQAAPATIRRQLYTPVKAIISFVSDAKLRGPRGENRRIDWLWPQQAEALIRALQTQPNPNTPALVTFLLGQGVRMGEAVKLQCRDVNLFGRTAIIRNPKNGHERTVTLIPRVIAALSVLPCMQAPEPSGTVFRRNDGQPFADRTENHGGQIRGPFANAARAAGLDATLITPHVCRHTWATWFYHATLDPLRLKHEGGWLSNEYQRYTHLVSQELLGELIKYGWVGENRGKVRISATKSTA